MSKQKRGRGQPRHYEERKEKVTLRITPTAIAALDATATQQGISRSELVEQYARGKQAKLAVDLLRKLEAIPRSPEKWDAKTKSEIYYGLEEAIKMALNLIDAIPCRREEKR